MAQMFRIVDGSWTVICDKHGEMNPACVVNILVKKTRRERAKKRPMIERTYHLYTMCQVCKESEMLPLNGVWFVGEEGIR